jgi:ABC-2 type transport system permease protein
MNGIRLYGRYAAVSILSQMQYPVAFVLQALAQFANAFVGFIGIWALFARFGAIRGWQLGDIALFYGTITLSFTIADALGRGFEQFGPEFVKTGNFDRLLLRPRPTCLQVAGHELRLTAIGKLIQGALVLAIAFRLAPIAWTPGDAVLLVWTVTGGVAIFCSLLIARATLAFWTVESLEVANIVTHGGVEAGQYPLDIYARWFRDALLFVVPIGCVGYLPLTVILGHPNALGAPAWVAAACPLIGWFFLAASLLLWGLGVRHYRSTGGWGTRGRRRARPMKVEPDAARSPVRAAAEMDERVLALVDSGGEDFPVATDRSGRPVQPADPATRVSRRSVGRAPRITLERDGITVYQSSSSTP